MPSAIHLFFIAAALPFLGRDRPTGPARLPKNFWHYTCHYIAGRASGSVSTIDRARRLGQREGYDGEREIRDEDAEADRRPPRAQRSAEHTSELQSLMRISYAVFCLNKKKHE